MLTVGRNYSGRKRNYNTECDICGVLYPVNELCELPNGFLACVDDRDGRTEVELDWLRAGTMRPTSFVLREDE